MPADWSPQGVTVNLDRVASYKIRSAEHAYTARDTMLYALGLGYGADPLSASDLKFVFEQGKAPLQAVPSFCVVLAHPGFWVRDPVLEMDWVKLLHGEQSFEMHKPLAAEGRVGADYEIIAVEDKGLDKGAICHVRKKLYDTATGDAIATLRQVLFLRGDGGAGGFGEAPPPPDTIEDGLKEEHCTIATLPQQALIYRLSGDYNPIHADPELAAKTGNPRPILHGLCTLGVTVRAAIQTLAGGDPDRIASYEARFSKPVYPGETIRVEYFGEGATRRFRARAVERDAIVLDRGTVKLA